MPRRKEHAQKQICVRTVTAVVFLISHCLLPETQQSVADSGPALGSALMRSGQRHEPAEQKTCMNVPEKVNIALEEQREKTRKSSQALEMF